MSICAAEKRTLEEVTAGVEDDSSKLSQSGLTKKRVGTKGCSTKRVSIRS